MINKISVDSKTERRNSINFKPNARKNVVPSFKGLGAIALAGIQKCEQMPMINVAVIDMLSAILPRTIVESTTNWFAGFEALRRESSGLIVNCLIPSWITFGIAACLNPAFMPKGVNMSGSWADRELIQKAADYYEKSNSEDKVKDALYHLLGGLEGVDDKTRVNFNKHLGKDSVNTYAKKLADISRMDISNNDMYKEVKKISKEIVKKTKVSENVVVDNVSASSVESMLKDSVKFFREFQRGEGKISMADFAKKNKNLVRTKSLLGLAVVLPLAASMQYINRWITGKLSGTKGAPIYDDFAKGENIEETPKAKEGLLRQKVISISSMLAVSLLSLTKLPTLKMLDFRGIFPTMDQARIISTTTFASRMAAADDKNELAEATVRDIATFASLYYLGDVAAKGAATYIQKTKSITLLNDMNPLKGNENVLKRFVHWLKEVNIKASNEVVSETEKMLNGAKPTAEQEKLIQKEIKKAINYRSYCQVTNLGVSLTLLGLIIPVFTRHKTKKNHEQALKLAQEKDINKLSKIFYSLESRDDLELKYCKLIIASSISLTLQGVLASMNNFKLSR